jgi:hypothetical protein
MSKKSQFATIPWITAYQHSTALTSDQALATMRKRVVCTTCAQCRKARRVPWDELRVNQSDLTGTIVTTVKFSCAACYAPNLLEFRRGWFEEFASTLTAVKCQD